MSRILSICSRVPYPLTGGAKFRMFYTARELARQYDVELLVVDQNPIDQSAVAVLEDTFDAVHIFSYPQYRFYLNTLSGLASRKPLQTHYYWFSDIDGWLDDNYHRFDLLYCNHVRTTEYARGRNLPVVVDLVDAISRNYQKASRDASGLWRFIYPIEWRRLRRYERRISQESDHTFIITGSDRQFVTEGDSFQTLSVLPNGVKPQLLDQEPDGYRVSPTAPKLVFLGKMNYLPNEDAAEYFAIDVFPRIQSKYPKAEFLIVGANPSNRIQALAERSGVTVTGFVENPREYLNRADIVVAPMRHGAGLQNKVLEAMALGRPVVATPLAQEGINAIDGKHLIVAEQKEAFANAVSYLISDADRRRSLGTAARELIKNYYTWNLIGTELRNRISDVLG